MDEKTYFEGFNGVVVEFLNDPENKANLEKAIELLKATKGTSSKIMLVGNGGSAAIAEHMAIDLTKNAGLQALANSGSPMITTISNDYGYERIFQKWIEYFGKEGDVLIAISSSGTSKNILNACEMARVKKMKIITFSGFGADNPLKQIGDLNFWVNSKSYGYVEILHNALIHYLNDAIIGAIEYVIR